MLFIRVEDYLQLTDVVRGQRWSGYNSTTVASNFSGISSQATIFKNLNVVIVITAVKIKYDML